MGTPGRFAHDGLTFDYEEWGPAGGDPVILLHGFPENRTSWREVAPALADGGYRVVAPDQRGYSPGARPRGRRAYGLDKLSGDVIAVADAVAVDRFHLVGHDWGGIIAWDVATRHAERVASLTSLSTPHPQAFIQASLRSTQLLKSWYMFLFQLPWLPEQSFTRFGGAARRSLVQSGLPPAFADDYLDMLGGGAATPAINYYRALPLSARQGFRKVTVPTLYVYSTEDMALGRKAADLTGRFVSGPYHYEVIEGASHWLPEERPDDVTRLVLDHLTRHPL